MTRSITLPAFAKINLSLRILGKRADGYHEIDTIFQTISLHDTITIQSTNDALISVTCYDHSVPSGPENLVHKAASALQREFANDRGAQITLDKHIPTQAGLGGGSADAAVTLIGLAWCWKLECKKDELMSIATDLGADVPFFFCGGSARGQGIGSAVTPLADSPEAYLLVLKPNANVSTAQAYASLNSPSLTTPETKSILSGSQSSEIFDITQTEAPHNDFESVVFELSPEIARAKSALVRAGARATLLAGSGSSVFGIFDNQNVQRRAIQAIELETGWRVFPCRTVGRNQYRSAMREAGKILARFDNA